MSNFGKNPSLLNRLAMPAGTAAVAVVAVLGINALGGVSRESAAATTALDELAAAVQALEARTAGQTLAQPAAPTLVAGQATYTPSPRAGLAPETHELAALGPTRGLQLSPQETGGAAPSADAPAARAPQADPPLLLPVEGALSQVQPNLAWSSMNPDNHVPTTEEKLAELVAASATAQLASASVAKDAPHSDGQVAMGRHGDAQGGHGTMEMAAPDPSLSACTNEIKTMAHRAQIHFAPGSTELDARGKAITAIIARKAAACPQAKITVEGFADPTGNYRVNTQIAQARAESALRELIRFAERSEGFTARSHFTGDSHPASCPHYDVVDRRVAFIVEEAGVSLALAD